MAKKPAETEPLYALARTRGGRREYWSGANWSAIPVWAPTWQPIERGAYLVTVPASLRPDVADDAVVAADRAALGAARDLETAQTAFAHSPMTSQALLERCLHRYLRAAEAADRTAS